MRRIGTRILAAAGLVAIVGCGRSPVAPFIDSAEPAGPAVAATAKAPQPGALQPPYTAPDPSEPDRVETSIMVNGGRGGMLRAGHVTLVIPKHAFSGRARVSMSVDDPAKLDVQLRITPAEKNAFVLPVSVEFDGGACGEDVRMMRAMWLDPQTGEWVQVESSADVASGKLTAKLDRFSQVRAECDARRKSGW